MLPLPPQELFLLGGAGAAVIGWAVVVPFRLAASGSTKLALVPAVLLAIAAFVPTALTIVIDGREALGEGQLAPILVVVYLAGALAALSVSRVAPAAKDLPMLWILLLTWLVALAANYNAELTIGRLSFWVVPLVLILAWRLRPEYRAALRLVAWVCLLVCAASLLFSYANPTAGFTDQARVAVIFPERLAGITEHPNALGLFSAVGTVLWWRMSPGRWFALPICVLTLIATDSRTAWFACAAGLLVLWIGGRQQQRPFPGHQLLVIGAVLGAVAWLLITFAAPEQQDGLTFTGRTEAWAFVADHWIEAPILGHGPSAWLELISAGDVPEWVGQAHNQFVQNLYTTGLVGVALLLGLLSLWTAASLRAARAGHLLPLALLGVVVVFSLFESPLTFLSVGASLWLVSLLVFLHPPEDGALGS